MVVFAQVVSSAEVVASFVVVGEQFLLSSIGDDASAICGKASPYNRVPNFAFRTTEQVPDGAQCVTIGALVMLNFFPR